MVQRREEPRLALEPREALLVHREDRRQHLDCDIAAKPGVARAVDLAHAASSKRADDFIGSQARTGG